MSLFKKLKNRGKRKQLKVHDFQVAFPDWKLEEEEELKLQWTREGSIRSVVFYPVPATIPFDVKSELSAKEYYTKKSKQMGLNLDHLELGYVGHVRTLATIISLEEEGVTKRMGSYTFYFPGFSYVFKWETRESQYADLTVFKSEFEGLTDGFGYSDFLRTFESY